ncbi:MAG: serine/threonine-protein phosphatase [Lachnospiraceae bacterium]|nr:serine/threonine-protein phosphatase [Lachnospiraceae bacterium]
MKYLTSVYWERGSMAERNQDSVVLLQVLTARGRVLMAAVCDGMGGLAQGEAASGYITRRLQEWFYESLLRSVQKRKAFWIIRRSLDRLVYDMQEQLSQYAGREKIRMGSTMTVLVLWEKTYLLWHLGDSRAYRLSAAGDGGRMKGSLRCMTTDHVRGRNQLTKCVGSFGYMRPDFRMGTFGNGQAMLLCSDGFRHYVTEEELADVLNPGVVAEEMQAERRLREIGEACMKRGEVDNLSAVYVKGVR